MGVFPSDQVQALALIAASVVTTVMGGATKLINKTFQETQSLPTAEANASSIRLCKELVHYGSAWQMTTLPADTLEEESYWLGREVDELLEAVYNAAPSDLVEAIARAFDTGCLDIPFPASRYARGAVIPARDADGAIRYLDMGQLPSSQATRDFHTRKLAGKIHQDIPSIVQDIYFIATGKRRHQSPPVRHSRAPQAVAADPAAAGTSARPSAAARASA
jgi:methylaspartate mutase epsilon subunit